MDPDRAIALLAERQHGLVSRPQARRLGLSAAAVGRRLDAGHWERLHQGIYRLAGVRKSFEQAILAACLAAGGKAVASFQSAAYLLGLPVDEASIEVTVVWPRSVELAGVVVHRTRRLEPVDTLRAQGIPATSVARTVIDLASVLSTKPLENVVDHVLANRLIPMAYLHARLEDLRPGRDGTAALRALLGQRPTGLRPRQSDAERDLLSVLREAGLPLPATQVPIRLPNGGWAYPDLCYEEERLIVEVDSYLHHSSLADWEADHVRTRDLVALRWRVLPVTASEIVRSPGAVAAKVREALGR